MQQNKTLNAAYKINFHLKLVTLVGGESLQDASAEFSFGNSALRIAEPFLHCQRSYIANVHPAKQSSSLNPRCRTLRTCANWCVHDSTDTVFQFSLVEHFQHFITSAVAFATEVPVLEARFCVRDPTKGLILVSRSHGGDDDE